MCEDDKMKGWRGGWGQIVHDRISVFMATDNRAATMGQALGQMLCIYYYLVKPHNSSMRHYYFPLTDKKIEAQKEKYNSCLRSNMR